MKTKAQQLGITEFPYGEYDGTTLIYQELENGYWWSRKLDNNGNLTYDEWYDGTKKYIIT